MEPDPNQTGQDRTAAAQTQMRFAALLEQQGKRTEAEDCFRGLIDRMPDLAVVRYNHACFLRRCGRLEEALAEHQKALDIGIDRPEEVLSNMGVIHTELHRDAAARQCLERALKANPTYIPAMYNLALLHEEFGDLGEAVRLFEGIVGLDPGYSNALVRLAYALSIENRDHPLFARLRRALRRPHLDELTRESLHFALGKALDDCGQYEEAFAQYDLGNRVSAGRVRPYDPEEQEARTAEIIRLFSPHWLASTPPVSERPLVFITGMFRSGSTLFEQVLAAHPAIAAGGEIDYFHRSLERAGAPFPASIAGMDSSELRRIGTGYLEYLDRTFPAGSIVTNKRPDAFAHLGLLKALYPNAKFVHTVRNPLDTCLSIWVQQLDGRVAYARELESIAHYYRQYRRIMRHWKQLFGASIFDAVYDDFVADREPVIRELLRFLGLAWHEGCLEFHRLPNRVRTASVWQVREPVYRRSSGRWLNYERFLEPLRGQLAGE
jgi:tetratricopeptide (TPR) repeat protein